MRAADADQRGWAVRGLVCGKARQVVRERVQSRRLLRTGRIASPSASTGVPQSHRGRQVAKHASANGFSTLPWDQGRWCGLRIKASYS
jgi:hypothetical protein